ncbi:DNA breaking-rejoining enzyme, partial [Exidia glandulosa HHB12029]
LNNYKAGFRHFQQWARAERIAWDGSTAVSERILCAYAASMSGVYAAGGASSKLAGLHFWHDQRGFTWQGSERLRRILKSVGLAAPPSARKEQRPPVTEAMLDEALNRLDTRRPFDVCVATAALVIFWGQLRLGEALSSTRTYDFASLPTGKCVKLRADAGGRLDQMTTAIWLPRTKTERAGVWIWLARHYNDPSYALQHHLDVNGISRDDPLFAYKHDTTGALVPLTRNAFLSRLNEIWRAAGMQTVTGHCFRIGGTTALLRAKVDPEVVKVAGRWKSDSFLRYWRTLDTII